ncbi:hypothetical protein WJX77_007342 [Trebouxia sp. C0004]
MRNWTSSGIAADIGKAEEEAVAVQERSQWPKAVVLSPVQSGLPRIFCSVGNPPSSSYPRLHPKMFPPSTSFRPLPGAASAWQFHMLQQTSLDRTVAWMDRRM